MSPLFFSSRSYIYKKFSMSPVHCQIRRLPLNLPGPVAVNLRHAVCWRLGDCCTYIVNPEIVFWRHMRQKNTKKLNIRV